MIGDLSGCRNFYIVTGRTDMRKSIDGLVGIIQSTFNMDPFENAAFFFCGRKADRIKVLHFDKDGMTLLYHRLDRGRYRWPRDASEVRPLTRQQLRWLLEGLEIDQNNVVTVQYSHLRSPQVAYDKPWFFGIWPHRYKSAI